jgi:hypothetical protein
MLSRLKGARPSPALVISLVALFVSLGGAGYAAVTITGKNVKNSSLTGKDVKNSSLTGSDVKNSSLAGRDIKNDSLTGSDVSEGSLGKVPSAGSADSAGSAGSAGSANSLGGQPASAYATKSGTEAVRLVGTPGNPGFGDNWGDTDPPGSGNFQQVGFWKDQFGIVHLQGDATRSGGTETDIFALPPGYRPSAFENFPVFAANGTAAGIAVLPTAGDVPGAVRLLGAPDVTLIGLGGVTFRAGG